MKYVLLNNDNVVIQKQTKPADGFIEVSDSAVCGQIKQDDGSFINPPSIELTYVQERQKAYPSLTDQADMAYWDRKNGTTTLDDAITAVKSAYPKT